ncbi:amino acid ABC transporter [Liquorilactobacillus sucicola DSM 21376 = JCM 15457]|uniref:Amino acid abc transporter atp-binding component n=1 Tax=Liquorilactobacillus sucicola DSM 21376 = JCM 15457 TaxID=1423806 RepID=A0A023CYK0_9LACO|nr:amino acid ABC transporter ATP-binding protein [Liquorilactobacillus sucicola]KRN06694.1 amino acid abc transporter atp-binding component [Liquorilactobacillus sucicola DSM 21376 = JCM 15457]GAJ26962.1 amino acid ABC transporter [Liquorilactobacillus sucicola DSM 21376 = JCM 15457]
MALLKVTGLEKKFNAEKILADVNFSINSGDTLVILGKSGAGKTTLLRSLNLLEKPDKGSLLFDERKINYDSLDKADIGFIRSRLAMVFQNYALFNNKTAIENIMEPLIYGKKIARKTAYEVAQTLLQQMELKGKANLYPAELSGGQQQRIGIARAEALAPKIILFDEPTSSLDPALVGTITADILELQKKKQTMIIVTHHLEFAEKVATKCIFLAKGKVIESNSANYFFNEPQTAELKEFLKNN